MYIHLYTYIHIHIHGCGSVCLFILSACKCMLICHHLLTTRYKLICEGKNSKETSRLMPRGNAKCKRRTRKSIDAIPQGKP